MCVSQKWDLLAVEMSSGASEQKFLLNEFHVKTDCLFFTTGF